MTETTETIPQLSATDPAAHSGDVVAENVAALKALFPQIVTDGKVDFEVLRQLLGDTVEESEERYGLNWKGKAKARAHALTPTLATLRPAREDSVDWDTTRNLMIEGDNLEVLKCLRKAYAPKGPSGGVKIIYIDPPYNTGGDFVYPDNYSNSISKYREIIGITAIDGTSLTSNKEGSGRFHTDWLNMILPRLAVAHEVLANDGFIFISCNDVEAANLRQLLNEIFGEDNFVADIIWKKSYGGGAKVKHVVIHHEHVICYAKNKSSIDKIDLPPDPEAIRYYKFKDSKFDLRGPYRLQPLATNSNDERANLRYAIPYKGEEIWPDKQWQWERTRTMAALENDDLVIERRNEKWSVSYKQYLRNEAGEERGAKPSSLIDGPYTQAGTAEIVELFDDPKLFSFPKPTGLIRSLISYAHPSTDFTVLDFFAGSGTTGDAVMQLNAADGGKRRYILVQLPEPLDATKTEQKSAAAFCASASKPCNIAELTKERLRRAGAKVKAEHPGADLDTGFRVYKLDSSNIRPWQPDADNLEASLLDAVSNIVHGRSEEDLLVELLLKTGIDLTTPEEVREIAGKTVHALGGGALIVCLADIADADAEKLGHGISEWQAELDPPGQTTLYFKDEGFASACAKANLAAILRQRMGDRIAKLASI